MTIQIWLLLPLVAALLLACAVSLVLAFTRRAGPGAVIGGVVLGGAALAVVLLALVPAVNGT